MAAQNPFALYAKWGLGTILSSIGPWFNAYMDLKLVSDYFQPGVNIAASASGALGYLVTYALWRGDASTRLKQRAARSLIAAVILLALLLGMKFLVGAVIAPDTVGTVLLWCLGLLTYLVFFFALGGVLAAVALLI